MTLRLYAVPQQGATYEQQLAVAQTAEKLGFGAYFRSDHYQKMGSGSPESTVTDCWLTLAGLARETSSIRLGSMVTPVTLRPIGGLPVALAQVDQMSAGRLEVGLGAGWFEDEHVSFGLNFPDAPARFDLLEDQLHILRGLWSADSGARFEYTGATTSVSIDADTVRPQQVPGPPIVLGGDAGRRSATLAVAFAAEYNVALKMVEETRDIHNRIRESCERAGRDPASMVYSVAQTVCCGWSALDFERGAEGIGLTTDDLRQRALVGDPQEIVDALGKFADAGVDRIYVQVLNFDDLDALHLLAERVMPNVPSR